MGFKLHSITFALILSTSFILHAQNALLLKKIKEQLEVWDKSDPAFKHGQVGFSLRNVSTGQVLINHHGDKSLVPASNLKLLTTVTALDLLGEDFTFKTTLQYSGFIDPKGRLDGHVFLKGGGDPTLGSEKIKPSYTSKELMGIFVEKIKAAGITAISGNVYADVKMYPFNNTPDGWVWGDLGNYYGASAGGLNLNDNLFKVFFKPGMVVGDSAHFVKTDPIVPGLVLNNMVFTGPEGTGDQASIYGGPNSDIKYMTGTVPKGKEQFVIKGSIPDPALFSAQLLYTSMQQSGIEVGGKPLVLEFEDQLPDSQRKNIFEMKSPALKDIVRETNMQSLNLHAEAIFKISGIHLMKNFSYDSTALAFKRIWKMNGMDVDGLQIADGSGLSFTNAITANQMTYLLFHVKGKPYFTIFYKSLPVAGISGSLSRMGKGTPAEGTIHAKTGTQTRVSCYSGYVAPSTDQLWAFSLLMNHYEGKPSAIQPKVEKLLVLLSGLQ